MRGPALRAYSICPVCCTAGPCNQACATCDPPGQPPPAPPPPVVFNPPVPRLTRLRRVELVGVVVAIAAFCGSILMLAAMIDR
jgi:hypothetical protein